MFFFKKAINHDELPFSNEIHQLLRTKQTILETNLQGNQIKITRFEKRPLIYLAHTSLSQLDNI